MGAVETGAGCRRGFWSRSAPWVLATTQAWAWIVVPGIVLWSQAHRAPSFELRCGNLDALVAVFFWILSIVGALVGAIVGLVAARGSDRRSKILFLLSAVAFFAGTVAFPVSYLSMSAVADAAGAMPWRLAKSPCGGLSPDPDPPRTRALAPIVAAQLMAREPALRNVAHLDVQVLRTFECSEWQIVYFRTNASDEAFAFYDGPPAQHAYRALWSGAAAPADEAELRRWARTNVSDAPDRLAACFAWYVTQARGK